MSYHWHSLHADVHIADLLLLLAHLCRIPKSFRHMDGAGVHTYSLINAKGDVTWVKFHWRTEQGVQSLKTAEEAAAVLKDGSGNSHATQDLTDSIKSGKFPAWKMYIQVMDPSQYDALDFNPLDATKTWPEDKFPLIPVGRLVLNENIRNFFQGGYTCYCRNVYAIL